MGQITNLQKDKRLCSLLGIRCSALIGGPFGAFHLISKNFSVFGNKIEAKRNLFYGLVSTILICGLLGLLPDKLVDKIPHYILPLIYVAIIGVYSNFVQGKAVKEGFAVGLKRYSKLKIVGVSILSLAISLAFLLVFVVFKDLGVKVLLPTLEYELGVMYHQGKFVQQNEVKAVSWFLRAAERDDSYAQNNLGAAYHEGKGVPQNDVEAAKWYRKSAEQGNPTGQNNLGFAYLKGQGVPRSDVEAMIWIRKAAEQGNAQAQFNLALAYHQGIGVSQNDNEALNWLRKAAAQGFPDARDLLQHINQSN